MPVFSCTNVSVLKIISFCAVGFAFILQIVGFSAKKWDEVDRSLYLHHYYAYQNLWSYFDTDANEAGYAFFVRTGPSIPDWKMQIIYLETTGFGMAVLSSILMFVSSFITKVTEKTKLQYTFSIMAVIGLFIGGSACIAGVKLYQNQSRGILSNTAHLIMKSVPGIYGLTWAPYMCIASGAMYLIVGVVLIIDVIIGAAKKKKRVLPHANGNKT